MMTDLDLVAMVWTLVGQYCKSCTIGREDEWLRFDFIGKRGKADHTYDLLTLRMSPCAASLVRRTCRELQVELQLDVPVVMRRNGYG